MEDKHGPVLSPILQRPFYSGDLLKRRWIRADTVRICPGSGVGSSCPWQTDMCRECSSTITKTCLYNVDPLKPHFYIVKVGFTGVYINFFISAQNIDCGYSLEPPCRGGSNEYPQSVFLSRNKKNIRFFYLKTFIFLVVKFSVYLNRFVFVMNLRIV